MFKVNQIVENKLKSIPEDLIELWQEEAALERPGASGGKGLEAQSSMGCTKRLWDDQSDPGGGSKRP